MQKQANFGELKQSVSMEMLLGHYGLLDGLKRVKEDELVGLCPFHEETKGSFHVSLSRFLPLASERLTAAPPQFSPKPSFHRPVGIKKALLCTHCISVSSASTCPNSSS